MNRNINEFSHSYLTDNDYIDSNTVFSNNSLNNMDKSFLNTLNLKTISKNCKVKNGSSNKKYLDRKLDISYITSKIIVCSNPIAFSNSNYKKNTSLIYKWFYKNKIEDLVRYLNSKYGHNNWMIFNLKVEFKPNEDYTDNELHECILKDEDLHLLDQAQNFFLLPALTSKNNNMQELTRAGWLDHQPPQLHHLFELVNELNSFLNQNENHIAVIHCKMGKGRSGCLVVAYLIKFCKLSLKDALELFRIKRFKYGIIKGVTIKSQLRYLKYFDELNTLDQTNNNLSIMSFLKNIKRKFQLKNITINISTLTSDKVLLGKHLYLIKNKMKVYFEIKFQTYNQDRTELIDIYKCDISNASQDLNNIFVVQRLFTEAEGAIFFCQDDIKISIQLKSHNSKSIINKNCKIFNKIFGLTVSYWINLCAETILTLDTKTLKLSNLNALQLDQYFLNYQYLNTINLKFDDCDNLSNKYGVFNNNIDIYRIFEEFQIQLKPS
ncbi:hypothetical protein QEN19_004304 [Hanseniaspora menglaensis]